SRLSIPQRPDAGLLAPRAGPGADLRPLRTGSKGHPLCTGERNRTMLTNPLPYLKAARAGGCAVGGLNVYNLESARAVIAAAAALRAPVLVQPSRAAILHAGLENVAALARRPAERAPVPVALHLDHGKSIEAARAAIEAGYTSVMIDTSRLPLAENIA